MRRAMLAAGAATMWAGAATAAPMAVPDGQPVVGSYAITYAAAPVPGGGFTASGPSRVFQPSGLQADSASTASAGSGTTARALGTAWTSKAEIASVSDEGAQIALIYAGSFINQTLVGAPGESATLTYQYRLDGSFTLGPQGRMALPVGQQMFAYLLAYRGHFLGYEVVTSGNEADMRAVSTNGAASLLVATTSPLYEDSLSDDLIAADRYCKSADSFCDGTSGAFDRTMEISFTIGVGEAFSVTNALFARTNGQLDLWNTLELTQVIVPQGFSLAVEDGGLLQRRPDGSYGLPVVPEPSTWAMLIAGFGLVGTVARRRALLRA